jgi:hypothetical protein
MHHHLLPLQRPLQRLPRPHLRRLTATLLPLPTEAIPGVQVERDVALVEMAAAVGVRHLRRHRSHQSNS